MCSVFHWHLEGGQCGDRGSWLACVHLPEERPLPEPLGGPSRWEGDCHLQPTGGPKPGLPCCPHPPCRDWTECSGPCRNPPLSLRRRPTPRLSISGLACWQKVPSVITLHIATAISNLPCTFPSIIPFNPAPWVAAGIREISSGTGPSPPLAPARKHSYNSRGGQREGRRWVRAAVLQAGLSGQCSLHLKARPFLPTPPFWRGASGPRTSRAGDFSYYSPRGSLVFWAEGGFVEYMNKHWGSQSWLSA